MFFSTPVEEIGPFQLENLVQNRVQFHLFDLRKDSSWRHPLLDGAKPLDEKLWPQQLADNKVGIGDPIVLVCENGKRSRSLAAKMIKAKYVNVYVLENGINSLKTG